MDICPEFHIVFDKHQNRVFIKRENEQAETWYRHHESDVATIMNGLAMESPMMSESLLEEIAKSIAVKAAETCGAVKMRYGTGRVLVRN